MTNIFPFFPHQMDGKKSTLNILKELKKNDFITIAVDIIFSIDKFYPHTKILYYNIPSAKIGGAMLIWKLKVI